MADLLAWKDSNVYFEHVDHHQEFPSKASECPEEASQEEKVEMKIKYSSTLVPHKERMEEL